LVETLPPLQANQPRPNLDIVTVFEAVDPILVALAKSSLEGAGIPFYVAGENTPVHVFNRSCRIQVTRDREPEARALLEDVISSEDLVLDDTVSDADQADEPQADR